MFVFHIFSEKTNLISVRCIHFFGCKSLDFTLRSKKRHSRAIDRTTHLQRTEYVIFCAQRKTAFLVKTIMIEIAQMRAGQ